MSPSLAGKHGPSGAWFHECLKLNNAKLLCANHLGVTALQGQHTPYTEEQLSSLIRDAPVLLLGPEGASGPLQGSLRAGRALYAALSDILLRACPPADGSAAARRAELLLGPLVEIIRGAESGTTPAAVVSRVAAVLATVVSSLQTSAKQIRVSVYQAGEPLQPYRLA
eukprot:scaffold201361_cov49-Prasinocladus_malaysianus.AAC.5